MPEIEEVKSCFDTLCESAKNAICSRNMANCSKNRVFVINFSKDKVEKANRSKNMAKSIVLSLNYSIDKVEKASRRKNMVLPLNYSKASCTGVFPKYFGVFLAPCKMKEGNCIKSEAVEINCMVDIDNFGRATEAKSKVDMVNCSKHMVVWRWRLSTRKKK